MNAKEMWEKFELENNIDIDKYDAWAFGGAQYLRLFVVDTNTSAIEFYEKNGFVRADGVYDEDLTLHEFGYEKLVEKIV